MSLSISNVVITVVIDIEYRYRYGYRYRKSLSLLSSNTAARVAHGTTYLPSLAPCTFTPCQVRSDVSVIPLSLSSSNVVVVLSINVVIIMVGMLLLLSALNVGIDIAIESRKWCHRTTLLSSPLKVGTYHSCHGISFSQRIVIACMSSFHVDIGSDSFAIIGTTYHLHYNVMVATVVSCTD